MSTPVRQNFRLGSFVVHPSMNRIRGDGREQRLEPKAMDVLVTLAEHPGEVVSRDELLDRVWSGTVVSEDVLNRTVSLLRKALDDDARNPSYIETIPTRGYRLVARISTAANRPEDAHGISVDTSENTRSAPSAERSLFRMNPVRLGFAIIILVFLAWSVADSGDTGERFTPRPVTAHPGAERSPALSADGSRIAYVRTPEGEDEPRIFVRVVDEESEIRLTHGPGIDASPAWSPDGRRIAFQRYSDAGCTLWSVPSLGGAPVREGSCGESIYGDVTWSPDGSMLAFNRRADGVTAFAIHTLRVQDPGSAPGESIRVTRPPGSVWGDHDPVFSGDGRFLAYVRSASEGMQDLYLMDLMSGKESRLTDDVRNIHGVTWSSDDRRILFSSNRAGPSMLWSISPAGGDLRPIPLQSGKPRFPTSASASNRLAFVSDESDVNLYEYLPNSDRTSRRVSFSSSRWDLHPHIAPNGASVAFVSNRTGSYEVWTATAEGDVRPLTDFDGPFVSRPRFSPDGRTIVFVARPDGNADLFLADPDDGSIRRLTQTGHDELAPSWEPGGAGVLFSSNEDGGWGGFRMDLETGASESLGIPDAYGLVSSPDGGVLYYVRIGRSGLWRRAAGTDKAQTEVLIDPAMEPRDWGSLSVTADGSLYFLRRGEGILRLTPAGSETLVLRPERAVPGNDPALAVSPDGERMLLGQIDRVERDVYVVDTSGR